MTKLAAKWVDVVAIFAVAYAFGAVIPAEWIWFNPGVPVVADSTEDKAPRIVFNREIKRDTLISYQVNVRDLDSLHSVCDVTSNPFTYRKDTAPLVDIDLDWWDGPPDGCWPLAAGVYLMETCWTIEEPFFGLLPKKTVCRDSPPFAIGAVMQ